jgi:hypothetical protein
MSEKVSKQKTIKNNEYELSKVEKFSIENNCKSLSLDQLCDDLKCSAESIEKYYNECIEGQKRADTIDKLMIVNSKGGYAIMSKEASEKGEATRKRTSPPLSEHIHRIRPQR